MQLEFDFGDGPACGERCADCIRAIREAALWPLGEPVRTAAIERRPDSPPEIGVWIEAESGEPISRDEFDRAALNQARLRWSWRFEGG